MSPAPQQLCHALPGRDTSLLLHSHSPLFIPRCASSSTPRLTAFFVSRPLVSPPSCLARCLTSSRCCLTSSLLAPRYLTSHLGPPYCTARAACRRSPASSIVQHANELSPPSIASCHLSGETWQRGCLLIVLKGFCTTLAILSFDPSGLMAQARQRIARAPAPGIKLNPW